jgi:hypothetical protein
MEWECLKGAVLVLKAERRYCLLGLAGLAA